MSDGPPILLLTRPRAASQAFADRLALSGVPVCISPLIVIEDTGVVPDLDGIAGVIFTSANAVGALHRAGLKPVGACFTVGDATADAVRDTFGIQARSASGDADDLVALVAAETAAGQQLLHLRGEHSRGAVAERLTALGRPTREAVLYRQVEQVFSPEAMAYLVSGRRVIAPLFSPRSARIFSTACPDDASIWGIAMSESVENALDRRKFVGVTRVPMPTADAMKEAVETALTAGLA